MRDYSKLLKLAQQNNGIIQTKIAVENKIPKDYLKFAVEDGILEKVKNGIYITKDTYEDEFYFLQLKNKNFIYSYETSAYFNDLTTRDPLIISITTTQGNNVSLVKSIYQIDFHYVKKSVFNLGLITTKTMFGNVIKIYDMERTICDLFSKRYKGDRYIAIESLKTYIRLKDRDLNKLLDYAKILGVEKQLKDKLEVLV